mmetsp:Transcript_74081/g.145409  ORF Transcript_74081/g.145409 Transcript_74081/m.145409 type:complete len:269 (+) Transcript_74081:117-923(+)
MPSASRALTSLLFLLVAPTLVQNRADNSKALQRSLQATLQCLESGQPLNVIAVLPPKAATRHVSNILQLEYPHSRECSRRDLHMRALFELRTGCKDDMSIEQDASYLERWMRLENLADWYSPGRTIAIVRDPMEQMLSYFSFTGEGWDWDNTSWISDFEEFLDSPINQNPQLGHLSGRLRWSPGVLPHDCRDKVGPPPTEADFERIRERVLSGLLILGTADRFEDTIYVFASALGFRRPFPPHVTATPPRIACSVHSCRLRCSTSCWR